MGRILNRLRRRFALRLFPLLERYADIDFKVKCREVALSEAMKLCEANALYYSMCGKQKEADAIWTCVKGIRLRIEHSDAFADELLRRQRERQ